MLFANRTLAVWEEEPPHPLPNRRSARHRKSFVRHAVNVTAMRGKAALIGLAAPPSIAVKLGRLAAARRD
jgi:hypothetical protein